MNQTERLVCGVFILLVTVFAFQMIFALKMASRATLTYQAETILACIESLQSAAPSDLSGPDSDPDKAYDIAIVWCQALVERGGVK